MGRLPPGKDLVVDDGRPDARNHLEHACAVGVVPLLAGGDVAGVLRAVRRVVVAAHLEIRLQVVAYPGVGVGVVPGEAGSDTRVAHHAQGLVEVVPEPVGVPQVHHAAVQVGARGSQGDRRLEPVPPDVGLPVLGADLGEPLDGAPLVPVLLDQVHDVTVGAAEERVDARLFSRRPRLLDALRGIVPRHLAAALVALVRDPLNGLPPMHRPDTWTPARGTRLTAMTSCGERASIHSRALANTIHHLAATGTAPS